MEQAFDWICPVVSAIHLSLISLSCRYYPTCSSYMIEAIQVHGAGKGSLMGISRILRCQPLPKGESTTYPPALYTKNEIPKIRSKAYLSLSQKINPLQTAGRQE